MTPDQRAEELKATLRDFEDDYESFTPKALIILDAASERLAQLEGDALVIEKVNGEWPEPVLERLHLALAAFFALDIRDSRLRRLLDQMQLVPLPDRTTP